MDNVELKGEGARIFLGQLTTQEVKDQVERQKRSVHAKRPLKKLKHKSDPVGDAFKKDPTGGKAVENYLRATEFLPWNPDKELPKRIVTETPVKILKVKTVTEEQMNRFQTIKREYESQPPALSLDQLCAHMGRLSVDDQNYLKSEPSRRFVYDYVHKHKHYIESAIKDDPTGKFAVDLFEAAVKFRGYHPDSKKPRKIVEKMPVAIEKTPTVIPEQRIRLQAIINAHGASSKPVASEVSTTAISTPAVSPSPVSTTTNTAVISTPSVSRSMVSAATAAATAMISAAVLSRGPRAAAGVVRASRL